MGANFVVGDDSVGTTLPAKLVKSAVVSPLYTPKGSGLSVMGISPRKSLISPTFPTALIEIEGMRFAILTRINSLSGYGVTDVPG
jgi:hypothetical protein